MAPKLNLLLALLLLAFIVLLSGCVKEGYVWKSEAGKAFDVIENIGTAGGDTGTAGDAGEDVQAEEDAEEPAQPEEDAELGKPEEAENAETICMEDISVDDVSGFELTGYTETCEGECLCKAWEEECMVVYFNLRAGGWEGISGVGTEGIFDVVMLNDLNETVFQKAYEVGCEDFIVVREGFQSGRTVWYTAVSFDEIKKSSEDFGKVYGKLYVNGELVAEGNAPVWNLPA